MNMYMDMDSKGASTSKIKGDIRNMMNKLKEHSEVHYNHSKEVAFLCNKVGATLRLLAEELNLLTIAGFLHDIGRIKISKDILEKEGLLSEKELKVMNTHLEESIALIKKDYPDAAAIVGFHHEFKTNMTTRVRRKGTANRRSSQNE